jgi:HPt (histidine-containing phosphotransfer) domain-containing protein
LSDGAALKDHVSAPVSPAEVEEVTPDGHPRAFVDAPSNRGILPARLPGIDIGRALETLSIDESALRNILVGFLADNRETLKWIKTAHIDKDRERMRQLAHGLKGSAGNIGAAELNRAAQALETACHEADAAQVAPAPLDGLIEALASALNQVLESIQSLGAPESTIIAGTESAGTGAPLDLLLNRLAEAIDRADPQLILSALPAVKQQAARCGRIDPFSMKRLEDQVNRYDYDQALETIRRISGILRRNT